MHDKISRLWNSISLRSKITGVTVLMLTFGLVVSGIGTMTVLRTYLLNQVNDKLVSAYKDITPFLGPGATSTQFTFNQIESAPTTSYVALLDSNGSILVSNSAYWSSEADVPVVNLSLTESNDLADSIFVLKSDGNSADWRAIAKVVTIPGGDYGTLVIAQPLQQTESTITTYLSIFLAFGIGVVVLGAMITRLLVTSTFAPLREVERTAAAFAEGDFSQRMSSGTPNTEVGRLNRSLNTMLSRIDRAFEDRATTIQQMRRFVGDASHELRTPLVSVRGYAELYRMGALQTPEAVGQAMERIEKEAIRMGSLVEDLLELARLDETKPLTLSTVNLIPVAMDAALDARASSPGRVVSVTTNNTTGPVVRLEPAIPFDDGGSATDGGLGSAARSGTQDSRDADGAPGTKPIQVQNATGPIAFAGSALARLRSRRPAKGATGEVAPIENPQPPAAIPAIDYDPDTDRIQPLVLAEENKIRQVLANLIGNALRFTPDDSPIELAVSVDEVNQRAIVDIVDHGEGIPPQIREKIFQRFWRADSSRTRETGGSGLGLAIVSSIIAAHNGTVEALETPGGGATFRVSLPLYVEPKPAE